ncbi:MAG: ATP-binding protein [Desulfuromonadaceae bacterium]|nr:ATP-binding protein [Desulfuromonadaceae bacterium]
MKNHSEDSAARTALREKLVGLGETSLRKTYYPELQQRLEELRESEAFLKNIVDNIPAMVFVKDSDELRYQAINKAGEELLGYSREELLGRNDYDFFPKEQADFFTSKDREVLLEGKLVEIPEYAVKTRCGGNRILHTKKIPLFDHNGKARYMLGISEDITVRKHLEEQLLQSQKMEAVGQLASGVAHDFNNILMVIMGYGSMLKADQTIDDQQRNKIELIMDAAEKASQLTRNLLEFGRKQQFKPRLADINDIVIHIRKFLTRIIGEDVQIRTTVATDSLVADVDSGQIEQVLINLATNARDAMPKGGRLTIETELCPATPPFAGEETPAGRCVCISVSDTGSGMDEMTKNRIFEPFFTTKEPGKGTGLGMSIVHGIVKQHNGFIDVVSEPDVGTTFRIYLPLALLQPVAVEPFHPTLIPGGNGETILVVEDDHTVAAMVQEILIEHGYQVILAADGQEAVETFSAQRGRIRLVLMDLVMPRMNGKKASGKMRKLDPGVRVIYTSGYTRDVIESRDARVDEGSLLMKPIPPFELLQRVRETLDR